MSIASPEALTGLPVGAKIRVDSLQGTASWILEKSEQGWMRDKVVILPDMLAGYIAAGRVMDMASGLPGVGEWWQGRTYYYLIRAVSDEQVTTLRWRRGRPMSPPTRNVFGLTQWTESTVAHIEPPSELGSVEVAMVFLELWQDAEARVQVQQQENTTLKNRPDPAPIREQVASARMALDRVSAMLTEPF